MNKKKETPTKAPFTCLQIFLENSFFFGLYLIFQIVLFGIPPHDRKEKNFFFRVANIRFFFGSKKRINPLYFFAPQKKNKKK
jgi:hypothetical protein